MATFDECYEWVLAWEGGLKLAHNQTEKFRTYAGINEKAHPEWPGWRRFTSPAEPPSSLELRPLVKEFYKHLWDSCEAAKTGVERDYFDTAVLQGPARARSTLFRMFTLLSSRQISPEPEKAWEDLKLLNLLKPREIREGVYRACRQAHLISITEANPKLEVYLWGWIRRARGDKP